MAVRRPVPVAGDTPGTGARRVEATAQGGRRVARMPAIDVTRTQAVLAAACASLLILWAVVVVLGIVLRRDTFHWDESSYAFRALVLYDDLRTGQLGSLLARPVSDQFMTYGFLQPYAVSALFVAFGPGFAIARMLGVLLMVATGIATFAVCSATGRRAGAVAGLIVVAALVSSPEMVDWHSQNMLEPLAVFLSTACVGVYVLSRGSPRVWPHCVTGLLVAAVFFTKHNYGVLLGAGIASDGLVTAGSAALRRQRSVLRRELWSYVLLACSAALPVLVWVRAASFGRVYATVHWELFDQWNETDLGARSYGERFVDLLALLRGAYFASPALGWYALGALVLAFGLMKERRMRALALITATIIVFIPASRWIQARYLITVVPPLLILAGLVPVRLLHGGILHRAAAGILLAGFAAASLTSFREIVSLPDRIVTQAELAPGYVWREANGGGAPANLVDVVEFVRARVPRQHSVATMDRIGFLSPYVWRLELHDQGAPVWTSNEFDDPAMPAAEYLVALDFGDAFPYQEDINSENRSTNTKLWSAYLAARAREGSVVIDAEKDFPSIATNVLIYRNVGATSVPLPAFLPPMKL